MHSQARWLIAGADPHQAEALAAALPIGLPAARVLLARGFTEPATARAFLAPSLEYLHDPFALLGMREAVDRLRRAIAAHENILIYGDYDVDGATSIVVLKKAIELAGGMATYHVPHRLKDGYGMRPEVVERAAAAGVSLIVSVDTGIRSAQVVRRAAELGIDVIVTDHHLPEAEVPPAVAVLNPNRPGCPYPEKNLCGVGVAFKLAQALLGTLGWPREKLGRVLASFLKLVAIGTIADVVPLTGENRVIVKHGLRGLHDVRNAGLRALLKVAGFEDGQPPSSGQIAFRVAPRINAAGRMDTATAVIEMFLTSDAAHAQSLAEQLHALNAARQQTEAQIIEAILEECLRSPVTDGHAALVFCAPNWHRGVLGIVASRLVERFHRPAFVLGVDEDGLAQGSGRSIATFHLLEALEAMPELFIKFGGHRHAAGITLPYDSVDRFRERLNSYAGVRLSPADFVPELEIDAAIEFGEIHDREVADVLSLAPFGHGNPAPLFCAYGVEVCGTPVVWKEKHLRVMLRQSSRTLAFKAWHFAARSAEFAAGRKMDVAFTLEEDPYGPSNVGLRWNAILRDVRPATATST